ncbi:hypothetical protein BDF14DRAFT_374345 [Spinellus fusiger]|nr:hypothetical protein BDF14DRAFT_374345 [Spinellus fusiger]
MGAQVVDYRVSTLVVLCKDCSQDVGLYPARHKCQPVVRPAMPAMPAKYSNMTDSSLKVPRKPIPSMDETASRTEPPTTPTTDQRSVLSSSVSDSTTTSKWNLFGKSPSASIKTEEARRGKEEEEEEESIYFNHFAAHLPETHSDTSPAAAKKLWGKVRSNDKWKQLNEASEKPKTPNKLWGKLVQVTQSMGDLDLKDDKGPESDSDDWEGESHVSRVLREHYEKKREALPVWLRDSNMPVRPAKEPIHAPILPKEVQAMKSPELNRSPSNRKQRLWANTSENDRVLSKREQELQEMRQPAQKDHGVRKEERHFDEIRAYPQPQHQENRHQENRHQENRHQENRHQENRHQEGRHHESHHESQYQENNSHYQQNHYQENSNYQREVYAIRGSREPQYKDTSSYENNYQTQHNHRQPHNEAPGHANSYPSPPKHQYQQQHTYQQQQYPPQHTPHHNYQQQPQQQQQRQYQAHTHASRDLNPNYSRDPNPNYSRDPNPNYSRDPNPNYSRDPNPNYSRDPNPNYSRDPNPNHSREPPRGTRDMPPHSPGFMNTSGRYR